MLRKLFVSKTLLYTSFKNVSVTNAINIYNINKRHNHMHGIDEERKLAVLCGLMHNDVELLNKRLDSENCDLKLSINHSNFNISESDNSINNFITNMRYDTIKYNCLSTTFMIMAVVNLFFDIFSVSF